MLIKWVERKQETGHRPNGAMPQRAPGDIRARDARQREDDERYPRRTEALATPLVQDLLGVLRAPGFQAAVNGLPGYDAARAGEVRAVDEELPDLKQQPARQPRTKR